LLKLFIRKLDFNLDNGISIDSVMGKRWITSL